MAFETGTATNYQDFFDKLLTFLQTDADLVAAGQEWEVAWEAPGGAANETDIVLRGPGLSGNDNVLVGLRLVEDVGADRFALHLSGMTGVLPAAVAFDEHVNCTPQVPLMFLDSNPMTYWFVANGRRFIAVAKISSVYEALYAGLFLPYAAPSRYSYPLFIGGSSCLGNTPTDWRSTHAAHTLFHNPYYYSPNPPQESCAWMLSPEGNWQRCVGSTSSTGAQVAMSPDYFGDNEIGMNLTFTSSRYGYRDIKDNMSACYGGDYALTPIQMLQWTPTDQAFGALHGVFHVAGKGNAAENIITINEVDHLVVQNAFRTSVGAYLAIALEE